MALTDFAMNGADRSNIVAAEQTPTAQPESVRPSDEAPLRRLIRWANPNYTANLAEIIKREESGEQRLSGIGMRVVDETRIDDRTRDEWMARSKKAMELAMLVAKTKSYPWPNSSNIVYPLMTIAAIQFHARAYPAVIQDQGIVKGVVYGRDRGIPAIDADTGQPAINPQTGEPIWAFDQMTGEIMAPGILRSRANRIGAHMSWQLSEEQPEWVEETDKLLIVLPITGCCFRKSFFDRTEMRNSALLVYAENLIINYWAKSLETAPRVTECLELYPHEIEENKRSGIFLNEDYGPSEKINNDPDAPHEFYEQHRRLDLDGDGYSEPYVVTVHKNSQKVARIVPRFDADGIFHVGGEVSKVTPVHYYTKYDFLPNPDGGIYGVGFGQLLGSINEGVNTSLNLMFDAGHLQTVGTGFIGRGLSMHSGAVKFTPGEFKPVNAPGRTVKDSIVQIEHPGPSTVLFQLLGFLVEAGREVASVKDILTGERVAANTPATTIMALIEQGLSVFTAIYKRVHLSLKKEYSKQFRLNRIYLSEASTFGEGEQVMEIRRADYLRGGGVAPISDPKSVSNMQRLGRAEFLLRFANDPLCDGVEIRRRTMEAVGVEDIQEILIPNPPPDPSAIAKAKELEIKEIGAKALAFANMALAIDRMASADLKVAEQFRTWVEAQMNALQGAMEQIDGESGAGAGAAPGGTAGPGNSGGPISPVAPTPGN